MEKMQIFSIAFIERKVRNMVNILIVTHGPLAGAFKESARMFFGDAVEKLETIGLFPSESPEQLQQKIEEKVNEIDTGDGVLIFVDIFAGSPFNMTALAVDTLKEDHKIESFTGVNMPVLMEALASCETMSIDELKTHIAEVSKDSIVDLRKSLEI